MIRFIRTASSRALSAAAIGLTGLLLGGAMVATGALSSDAKPAPKSLAQAVVDSQATRGTFSGVAARVTFKNSLVDSSVLGQGSDPLLGGGSGRLWADNNGNLRIELQSDGGGGDVQIVANDKQVWVSYGTTSTVYRAAMPARADKKRKADTHTPITVTTVENALKAIAGDVTISDPTPDNIGGRPAYTVTMEPKDKSGLLAGARVSWDASNGAPLAVALLAKGQADPVLDLHATDVQFGPVDASIFAITPPADAKIENIPVTDLLAKGKADAAKAKTTKRAKPVTGLAAVQAALPFTVNAPASLAGMDRTEVMLLGKDKSAVITYGTGLGAIAVVESAAKPAKKANTGGLELPTKTVGGVTITEFGTALGSIAMFTRDGVSYTLVGSVTTATLESAVSGL
ncbi:MAG: hypothetical protein F2799_06015 [Actinobacteria bacterium]|uniref:Unannotated protein n=1 Tax=freshwater metagenome TaxID=449393 RepID=A0A6J7EC82_9ZZZZ|nr:hypothetical protein [Actinomycetota bacterium]